MLCLILEVVVVDRREESVLIQAVSQSITNLLVLLRIEFQSKVNIELVSEAVLRVNVLIR